MPKSSFTSAADLFQKNQRQELREFSQQGVAWSQEDWSQQERLARERLAAANPSAGAGAMQPPSALVGPMSSQLFRLAFELSYHRKGGAAVAYESVDVTWCWGGFAAVPVSDRQGRRWRYEC